MFDPKVAVIFRKGPERERERERQREREREGEGDREREREGEGEGEGERERGRMPIRIVADSFSIFCWTPIFCQDIHTHDEATLNE